MAKTKIVNKKPPIKPVDSGTYTVEIDGETYHPHSDETVTFRSRGNIEHMMLSMRLYGLSSLENTEAVKSMEEGGVFDQVIEHLSSNISAWTWTDDNGDLYLSPPDVKTIRSLEFTEIGWLLSNQGATKPAESIDERKNDSETSSTT